jgi:hypothetical protein
MGRFNKIFKSLNNLKPETLKRALAHETPQALKPETLKRRSHRNLRQPLLVSIDKKSHKFRLF